MPKFKIAKCVICHMPIHRHDEKRVPVKVGNGSSGQGVFKDAHLGCTQAGA